MTAGKKAQGTGCFPARTHPRHGRFSLRILLLLLLTGIPLPAWGGEGGAPRLQRWYRELYDLSQGTPFGVPLRMHSEERNDQVTTEVYAIFEHPFDTIKAALSSPFSWCEIAPLNVTVKACTYQIQPHQTVLTLYIGRKYYQRPQEAASQPYQFVVHAGDPGTLSVHMSALMERYPLQLHDLEKAEYLDAKRREREDQLRLQQNLSGATLPRNSP